MAKNIMITEALFVMLLKHFVFGMEGFENEIKKELENKMESLNKRMLYTKFKTAPTKEEREQSRVEYLDLVGMSKDFRWQDDSTFCH